MNYFLHRNSDEEEVDLRSIYITAKKYLKQLFMPKFEFRTYLVLHKKNLSHSFSTSYRNNTHIHI